MRIDGEAPGGFAPLSGFWRSTRRLGPHPRQLPAPPRPPPRRPGPARRHRPRRPRRRSRHPAGRGGGGRRHRGRRDRGRRARPHHVVVVGTRPCRRRRAAGDRPPPGPRRPRGADRGSASSTSPASSPAPSPPARSPSPVRTSCASTRRSCPRSPPSTPTPASASARRSSTPPTRGCASCADTADVVVTGYRPGALDRFGLAPEELLERRPDLVVVRLDAWGWTGPWARRRGFDSIVQAASGIAVACARDDGRPGALPAQALDHATGYLAAASALLGPGGAPGPRRLDPRAGAGADGGVAVVGTGAGLDSEPGAGRRAAARDARAVEVPPPAVVMPGGPSSWVGPAHELGADEPEWLAADEWVAPC